MSKAKPDGIKARKRSSFSESGAGRRQPQLNSSLAFGGLTLSSLPQHRRASRERLTTTGSLSLNSRGSEKALAQLQLAKLPMSAQALNDISSESSDKKQGLKQNHAQSPKIAVNNSSRLSSNRLQNQRPRASYSRQHSLPSSAGGVMVALGEKQSAPPPVPILKPAASYRQLREYFIQRQKYVVGQMHLMPAAPDGGWGWVIVIAAFLTTAIVEGIAFSFAPILIHLTTEAPHKMLQILFMGATLISTYLLICPLAMSLVNAFGYRKVLFTGSLISTVGFLIPYYVYAFSSGAPVPPADAVRYNRTSLDPLTQPADYNLLIVSYGGIAGIGFGLMYMSALVAVSQYFELNRALAMGIALCGSGAGALVLPPILTVILEGRGFDGAVTMLAGLTLNGAAAALLLRPLKLSKTPRKRPRKKNTFDRVRELQREIAGVPPRVDSEQSLNPEKTEEALLMCKQFRLNQLALESGAASLSPSRGEMALPPEAPPEPGSSAQSKRRAPSAPPEMKTILSDPGEGSDTPPLILVNDANVLPRSIAPPIIPSDGQPSPIVRLPIINTDDPGAPDPQDSITKLKATLAVVLPPPAMVAAARPETSSPMTNSTQNVVDDSKKGPSRAEVLRQQILTNRRFHVVKTSNLQKKPVLVPAPPPPSRRQGRSISTSNSNEKGHLSVADLSRPLYRVDILYGRSVNHLPRCQSEANMEEYRASAFQVRDKKEDMHKMLLHQQSLNDGNESGLVSRQTSSIKSAFGSCYERFTSCLPKPCVDPMEQLFDKNTIKDSAFIRIAFGSALCMMAVPLPYFVLPWRALVLQPQRLDEDPTSPLLASCLISIIGGATMAGRLVSGFVSDLPNMNILLLHNMALWVTTVATFMAHMANQFAALCVYAGIFGFCYAFHMALASTVLGDEIGVEKLTSAFGLVTIMRGLAPLCTIPLLTLLLGEPDYCVSGQGQGEDTNCPLLPATSLPRSQLIKDEYWFAWVPKPPRGVEAMDNLSDVTNGYRRVLWLSGSLFFVSSVLFTSLHLRPGANKRQTMKARSTSHKTTSESSAGGKHLNV